MKDTEAQNKRRWPVFLCFFVCGENVTLHRLNGSQFPPILILVALLVLSFCSVPNVIKEQLTSGASSVLFFFHFSIRSYF